METVSLLEKYKQAVSLLLAAMELRIFGVIFYHFKSLFTEIPKDVPAKYRDIFTAHVSIQDGRPVMQMYESMVKKMSKGEILFVLLHEVTHVLGGHLHRLNRANPHIANLAMDHVINIALIKDIKAGILKHPKTPEFIFYIKELYDQNMSIEQVYEWLMKHAKITKITNFKMDDDDSDAGQSQGQGSGSGGKKGKPQPGKKGKDPGEGEDENNGSGTSEDNTSEGNSEAGGGGYITIIEIDINGRKHTFVEDMRLAPNGQKSKEISDEIQGEARAIADSQLQKGDRSGAFAELINQMIKVEIPWSTLLEKAILTTIVVSQDSKSWRNINKRYQGGLGITMPGDDTELKYNTMLIARDTSGSIGTNDLRRAADITLQSANHVEKVIICNHDVEVHNFDILEADEVEISDLTKTFEGRGGTSHEPVFTKIQELINEGETEISLAVFITDFYSDVEQIWNEAKFPWIKDIPCIWILNNNQCLETAKKYGTAILIKDEK